MCINEQVCIQYVSVPLIDMCCGFEHPNLCKTTANCTDGSKYLWDRRNDSTQSLMTGPIGDGLGNLDGT